MVLNNGISGIAEFLGSLPQILKSFFTDLFYSIITVIQNTPLWIKIPLGLLLGSIIGAIIIWFIFHIKEEKYRNAIY